MFSPATVIRRQLRAPVLNDTALTDGGVSHRVPYVAVDGPAEDGAPTEVGVLQTGRSCQFDGPERFDLVCLDRSLDLCKQRVTSSTPELINRRRFADTRLLISFFLSWMAICPMLFSR